MSKDFESIDAVPIFEFWRHGCQAFAKNVYAILSLTDEELSFDDIVHFIQTMPRTSSQLSTEEWRGGYCSKFLEKVFPKLPEGKLNPAWEYILVYFPKRTWTAQVMLMDAFIGMAAGMFEQEIEKGGIS